MRRINIVATRTISIDIVLVTLLLTLSKAYSYLMKVPDEVFFFYNR